ncbi:MAG: NAD-dependent epimerase/dehydratase family protein [Flavobacteriaceae bacterium]|nr:NAD-dependent epimerase/dehydratase family protein [Flavobacteriaceae bacterium]
MKRILITGSNGLLGQTLLRKLQKKADVEVYALSKGANRLKNTFGYTYFNIDLVEFDHSSFAHSANKAGCDY